MSLNPKWVTTRLLLGSELLLMGIVLARFETAPGSRWDAWMPWGGGVALGLILSWGPASHAYDKRRPHRRVTLALRLGLTALIMGSAISITPFKLTFLAALSVGLGISMFLSVHRARAFVARASGNANPGPSARAVASARTRLFRSLNAVDRFTMSREMRRKRVLPPEYQVSEATGGALLKWKINNADRSAREQGPWWVRWTGRLLGGPMCFVFLMEPYLFLRTWATRYATPTALVLLARRSGTKIELIWATKKHPDHQQAPGLIPEGEPQMEGVDYYIACVETNDGEAAQRLVDRIVRSREDTLASQETEATASLRRIIGELADLPLE